MEAFERHLAQDALYQPEYAGAMRRIAERLPDGEERALFRHFAEDGVAAEQEMQAGWVAAARGRGEAVPSPACGRCIGHVRQMGGAAPLPVALAGVFPCFSVYAETGARLAAGFGIRI